MVVHRLEEVRVLTRTFLVSYWPDLGAVPGQEIKLGVFGDLRLGKRYALGLIARSNADPTEVERVGRLARRLVENPYKTLRERYEEIWASPNPQDTFQRMLSRPQSSLVFSEAAERRHAVAVADLKEDLETARDWCKDHLRPILRDRFHNWIGTTGLPEKKDREQFDEWEAQVGEPLKLAVG